MQLNEYLIRYNINKGITFGVAVVVAENINKANNLLKVQGNYNGSGYDYIILETVLINNTDQYNTSAILEEIATTSGDSAYDIAKKYGFKGTESEWLTSLKGDKGDKGEPLTWNTMDSEDKISLKEDIIKEIKSELSATPSGDPLHYAYESVGAVWNDTDEDITSTGIYGDTIVHKAKHWLLNEIGDIANREMFVIYSHRFIPLGVNLIASWWAGAPNEAQRTNIMRSVWSSSVNAASAFGNNKNIEVVSLGFDKYTVAIPTALNYMFAYATKLHTVINIINLKYATSVANTCFEECVKLKNIRCQNLKTNISFHDSPLLSKASLLYMIDNCYSNATFTITLHADVYAKCVDEGEWVTDIENAISSAANDKETVITLASA